MSWKDFDWTAVLLAALLLLLLFFLVPAHAYDATYCKLYSREMMRAHIRHLQPDALADLTTDSMMYILNKYETRCLLIEDMPDIKDLPSDGKWVSDTWSSIQSALPHPAPVVTPPEPVKPPPLSVSKGPRSPAAATPKKPASVKAGADQELCLNAGKKTVYTGLHWRCIGGIGVIGARTAR